LKIIESLKNKILIPFRLVPKDGLTPEKLAFSVTIGIVAGLFPVIGTTTILSLLLTLVFRQNLLVVQSVQWITGLAQVLLIIPFMQFGAYILNHQHFHINVEQITLAFQPGILTGIKTIGIYHLYGILSWAILALPVGVISYFSFLGIFHRVARNSINTNI